MPQTKIKFKQIKKRDGRIVDFDQSRITRAISAAGQATGEFNLETANRISDQVVKKLGEIFINKKNIPDVENIQDLVEIVLMKENYIDSVKSYIIYRKEHQNIREEKKRILNGKNTRLPLSLNSLKILAGRYLAKDAKTRKVIESPEEMFQRVAKAISGVEKKYGKLPKEIEKWRDKFYQVMYNFEFLPAGRTLTNAGTAMSVISNCVVLHIEDSVNDIFKTLRDAALLQQSGSGIGFPFHLLRPAGSLTKKTQGVSTGPLSFLRVYDKAFGVIKQQGRHGANMAVMRVDHPDILDFIHAKDIEGELSNFNISISLTDEFMKKVKTKYDKPWLCQFKGKKMLPRRITRDRYGQISQIQEIKMTPGEIMAEIANNAWINGEPGIIFIDRVNKTNPLPGLGRIEASNPCGEQFLHDGDVCNLGSINLDRFVDNKKIKWDRLKEVTELAVRMLDNVVDITKFSIDRTNKTFKKNRRIGIGIMGFADFLFQLEIPYNSEQGFNTAEKVMKFINQTAHNTSSRLAEEKGIFPNYDLSVWKKRKIKMRNAALTCIAPTGTISMIPEVSSGVEPYFALSYTKKQVMGKDEFYYVNHYLEKKLKEENLCSNKIINKIYRDGSIQNIKEIPKKIRKIFVGSMDIKPQDHIRMEVAFQKYLDNSISKTINLPNETTRFDVEKVIQSAWQSECKAFTVYRSGSREKEVLTIKNKTETDNDLTQEDVTPPTSILGDSTK
jgi:ribonucleoside-diphosphate reductase alpha chain